MTDLAQVGMINIDALIQEVQDHAQIYGDALDAQLTCALRYRAGCEQLNAIMAEAETTLRKNSAMRGEKLTDKAAASIVMSAPGVVTVRTNTAQAEDDLERAKAVVKVLDKKESMMKLLTQLLIKEVGAIGRTQ